MIICYRLLFIVSAARKSGRHFRGGRSAVQASAQVCVSKKRETRLLPKGGAIIEELFGLPVPFSCKSLMYVLNLLTAHLFKLIRLKRLLYTHVLHWEGGNF